MPLYAKMPVTDRAAPPGESRGALPPEVNRLLAGNPAHVDDEAWASFVTRYSGLLLRVATAFAPGYDGAMDRYAFMLDELRRSDYRRLRCFAADGRGTFSTWLTVVARRLCLDHYRREHGRLRGRAPATGARAVARVARRELAHLDRACADVADLPAPPSPDPADLLDERDRRAELRRMIGQLSSGDQSLLRLRFEQNLTAREIAIALRLPSPFHVYRRLEAIYRVVRERIGMGSPGETTQALRT